MRIIWRIKSQTLTEWGKQVVQNVLKSAELQMAIEEGDDDFPVKDYIRVKMQLLEA